MKIKISYRHLNSTPSIDTKIRAKLEHLSKLTGPQAEAHWTCSVNKEDHLSEVTIHDGHHHYHASSKCKTLYQTMDEVLAKLEKQIKKSHEKERDKIHRKNSSKLRKMVEQSIPAAQPL